MRSPASRPRTESSTWYAQVLVDAGLPVELGDMFRGILDGRNATPAAGVQQALGRPARDFSAYAARAAAAGSWG